MRKEGAGVNKQRRVLITTTYNEVGIIIDTKTEEVSNNSPKVDSNSGDLISRQDAINGKISVQRANGVEIYSDDVVPVKYLKNLPPVQPERKKGKWIYKEDLKQYFCSECGYPSLTHDDVYIYSMDLPNFCEECGADMRTANEEGD